MYTEGAIHEKTKVHSETKATQGTCVAEAGFEPRSPLPQSLCFDYSAVLPLLPEIPSFLKLSSCPEAVIGFAWGHILSGFLLSDSYGH